METATVETNNKPGKLYMILLALSPFLGLICEAIAIKLYFLILEATTDGATYFFTVVRYGFFEFYFLQIMLFIGLGYLDRKDLEKRGFDVSTLNKFWLPPVYLFNRAKMFKKSGLSSIIWFAQFAVTVWIHYLFYSFSV